VPASANRFLVRAINVQKSAMRFQTTLAIIIVCIGIVILLFSEPIARMLNVDAMKRLIQIAGAFSSSLATFPYKEIAGRKEKIVALQHLNDQYRELDEKPNAARRKKLDEICSQLTQKMLGAVK
jgi:hypothetical protein